MFDVIVNAPIFIALITAVFSIVSWLINKLFSKFNDLDNRVTELKDKTQALEFNSVELINNKITLDKFGGRIGQLESEDAVLKSNLEQIKTALNDEKLERQQSSQVMIDILSKLGELTTNIAVIATKLESIDNRLTRLESKR